MKKEVTPWLYVDKETGRVLLRVDAPEDIKKKYDQYIKSIEVIEAFLY